MSQVVALKEPVEINAGDSVVWSKTFADFPATTWTLTYRLLSRLGAVPRDFGGTASGSDFRVTLAAAFTALFTPGSYTLIGYLTDGTERFQIYRGNLIVNPDPATVDSVDNRTYLEKVREKLETVLLKGVIRAPIRFSYGGVSTEVMSLKDALDALDRVKAAIIQEESQISGKQRKILTRFTRPL